MPFTLAIPNPAQPKSSKDGPPPRPYVRTRFSDLTLFVQTTITSPILIFFTAISYALGAAIAAAIARKTAVAVNHEKYPKGLRIPSSKHLNELTLGIPSMEFVFAQRPSPAMITLLVSNGAVEMTVPHGKTAVTTYRVESPIPTAIIEELRNIYPTQNTKYDAKMGYITVKNIWEFKQLRKVLNYACHIVHNSVDYEGKQLVRTSSVSRTEANNTIGCIIAGEDFMEDVIDETVSMEVEQKVMPYHGFGGELVLVDKPVQSPYTSLIALQANVHGGMSIPYNQDYVNFDNHGVDMLFAKFFSCFRNSKKAAGATSLQVRSAWAKEFMSTKEGMVMGHMVKVLDIAIQANAKPVFVFTGSRYYGSFLFGCHYQIFRMDGEKYRGVSDQDDINAEVAALDRHTVALNLVLTAVKMPAGTTMPTTMRELRRLVFAGGRPGAMIEQVVKANLPEINFVEKSEGYNVDAILGFVKSVSPFFSEIDNKVFLDRSAFFSEDPYVLSLARFGARAPTFGTGTVLRAICPTAKGQGITKAAPYSGRAPTILQYTAKSIFGAATDWKKLLENGLVSGLWDKRDKDCVQLKGDEKDHMWSELGSAATAKQNALSSGTTGQPKRKGDDELEEGELGEADGVEKNPAKVKKRKVIADADELE